MTMKKWYKSKTILSAIAVVVSALSAGTLAILPLLSVLQTIFPAHIYLIIVGAINGSTVIFGALAIWARTKADTIIETKKNIAKYI